MCVCLRTIITLYTRVLSLVYCTLEIYFVTLCVCVGFIRKTMGVRAYYLCVRIRTKRGQSDSAKTVGSSRTRLLATLRRPLHCCPDIFAVFRSEISQRPLADTHVSLCQSHPTTTLQHVYYNVRSCFPLWNIKQIKNGRFLPEGEYPFIPAG